MEIAVLIIVYCLVKLLMTRKRKPRPRRPPFKKLHKLNQIQPIVEFEEKMIKGMFAENKEVFVTAFVNDTHVLKVTATIGSKYTCRPSDNVYSWGEKACKIGATKIRQYHNHPNVFGRSSPSTKDRKTHRALKPFIEQWGIEFQSLLVYKSWFRGVRVKEYQ